MLVFISIAWTCYYAIHSLFASNRIKRSLMKAVPAFQRSYRLLYSSFAILGFSYLVWLQLVIPKTWWLGGEQGFPIIGYILLGAGAVLLFGAMRNYSFGELMGTQQLTTGSSDEVPPLQTEGFNGIVRHPLYFSMIFLLLGYLSINFTAEDTAFILISILYLFIGAWLEEQKLLIIYGEEYRDYQSRVFMLIPYLL